MKKRKLKNYLKIGILLFGISLTLWNCENDLEAIDSSQEKIDFTIKPKIETFNLHQLNRDTKFKELKNNYNILQNDYFNRNSSAHSVDTLGVTIDENSIKRITGNNYISYTMLMIEPEDTSGNFSNLVIQEKEGVQRIFTVRYSFNNTAARSSSENITRDIQMRTGIHQLWEDDDGGGGSGSGNDVNSNCEEYTTVCNTVNVWIPIPCGCGLLPGEGCRGEDCGLPLYPYHDLQTQEECEDICVWEGYNDQINDNNNNSTGGSGNTGNSNDSEPTDVATSPVDPNAPTEEEIKERKCLQLKQTGASPNFQQRVNELRNATRGNKEILYYGVKNNNTVDFPDSGRLEGLDDKQQIPDHSIITPVDAAMHNHFGNSLPFASPEDLYTFFKLYDNDLIANPDTFMLYVVAPGDNVIDTSDDTIFALSITNKTKFKTIGRTWLSNLDFIKKLFIDDKNKIHQNISTNINVKRFVKLLKKSNFGLTLYEGNLDDLTDWKELKHDGNNNPKKITCN